MTGGVGSLAWAQRTRGRLGTGDRVRLLAQALLARAGGLLPRRGRAPIDLGALRVPDSALATAAADHLASVAEPWLVNHCWRTYAWGWLHAAAERRALDEEALFVAALLHDLGLTATPDPAFHCFAVEGAMAAARFLEAQGAPQDRRDRVADAISLHMNATVPPAAGAEAHLLHEGAAMDVVGARLDEVADPARQEVLARHPRLAMKAALVEQLKRQSALRPDSRAAFLCRLGFIGMVRRAPFEDGP